MPPIVRFRCAQARDRLLADAVRLSDLARRDPDVGMAVNIVLVKTGHSSVGPLAEADPDTFYALLTQMMTMVEELPARDVPAHWQE